MTMLIMEGGRTALELLALVPRSVLVSEDEALLAEAGERFTEDRLKRGAWSTELLRLHGATMVVLGYDDGTNLRIGRRLVAAGDLKVACFCQDPARIKEFREAGVINIYCPVQTGARAIAASLDPRARDLIEIPIFGDSPLLGKKVDDVQYGLGATLVGIMDGQEIHRPEGRFLEKGNHMLIATMGVKPESLQKVIVRKESRLRVFHRVVALVRSAEDVSGTLPEAAYLANVMRAELVVIAGSEGLLEPIQGTLRAYGLRYCLEVADLEGLDAIGERLRSEDLAGDCLVMSIDEGMAERRPFRKWRVRALLDGLECSVLVSRRRQPYFSILTMMDGSEESKAVMESSFKMGFLARASMTVLRIMDDLAQNGAESAVRSMSKLYGVRAVEMAVEGNPTVEFVSQIRSGKADLAILNWGCSLLRDDILGRALSQGPVSLLFLKG